MIADRNYYVCRVKVTYDEEKIKSLKIIAFVCNNFLEIKEDIQLCIDYDPSCKYFWMYHYRTTLVTGFGNIFTLGFISTFMNFVGMINKIFLKTKNFFVQTELWLSLNFRAVS